jgi:hypothetical protein
MTRDSDTFVSSLSQAARDNPLAAALIGGGALWLMFGNRPIASAPCRQSRHGFRRRWRAIGDPRGW